MRRSRVQSTNISDESFVALLDALGFVDKVNRYDEQFKSSPYAKLTGDSYLSHYASSSSQCRSLSPVEEAPLFEWDYADYSFGSDLNEDSSDNDATLPSRPCSSGFDAVDPTLCGVSLSPRLPRPSYKHRPRPLALYLPDGLPFQTISSFGLSAHSSNSGESQPPTPDSADYNHPVHIKAALNATIVMIRVSSSISLTELKQKLYDKFVGQEGIRLSRSFCVVSVLPPSHTKTFNDVRLSLDRSQLGFAAPPQVELEADQQRRFSFAERTQMRIIDDEWDWKKVLAKHNSEGTKVTLRILDTPT